MPAVPGAPSATAKMGAGKMSAAVEMTTAAVEMSAATMEVTAATEVSMSTAVTAAAMSASVAPAAAMTATAASRERDAGQRGHEHGNGNCHDKFRHGFGHWHPPVPRSYPQDKERPMEPKVPGLTLLAQSSRD